MYIKEYLDAIWKNDSPEYRYSVYDFMKQTGYVNLLHKVVPAKNPEMWIWSGSSNLDAIRFAVNVGIQDEYCKEFLIEKLESIIEDYKKLDTNYPVIVHSNKHHTWITSLTGDDFYSIMEDFEYYLEDKGITEHPYSYTFNNYEDDSAGFQDLKVPEDMDIRSLLV